jgi:uncharacterized protein
MRLRGPNTFSLFFSILTGFLAAVLCHAQDVPDPTERFNKTEAMIPTRDGIKLNTEIYVPKDLSEPLPILLLRTPYGIASRPKREFSDYLKELAEEGYIFVYQDIRGRYKSEGQFDAAAVAR